MNFTNDELHIIGMSSGTWINMLRVRQDRVLSRMHSEYRAGKTDFLALVSELVCVREQINEIISAVNERDNRKE